MKSFLPRVSPQAALAAVAVMLCVLALTPGASATPGAPAAPTPAPVLDCTGPYKIDKTFRNGARWQLCWDIGNPHGLRVLNARYTPKGHGAVTVLRDLSLAQVHVPYDEGGEFSDMPLDPEAAVPLKPSDCPGGELRTHNRKALVCTTTHARGYAYKKFDADPNQDRQRQGQEIALFSVFEIGDLGRRGLPPRSPRRGPGPDAHPLAGLHDHPPRRDRPEPARRSLGTCLPEHLAVGVAARTTRVGGSRRCSRPCGHSPCSPDCYLSSPV